MKLLKYIKLIWIFLRLSEENKYRIVRGIRIIISELEHQNTGKDERSIHSLRAIVKLVQDIL